MWSFLAQNLVTIVLLVMAVLAILTGIMLITGKWKVPENKQGKVTIVAITGAFVLGILSLLFIFNPKWARRLRKQPT